MKQYADISIPVELSPDTTVGRIEVECCAEPSVCYMENEAENTCEITVLQMMQIRIPITCEISARADTPVIDCTEDNELPEER